MKPFRALLCLVTAIVIATPVSVWAGPKPGLHFGFSPNANPTFTAAWGGIWNMTLTDKDCDTHAILDTHTEQDTICTGSTIAADPGFALACDGTIDDTSVNVSCSGTFEPFPECLGTFTYTVSGSRSGNTLSGTSTTTITYVGAGCEGLLQDYCQEQDVTGTRIGSEPAECGLTPAVPATWGLLKARYSD